MENDLPSIANFRRHNLSCIDHTWSHLLRRAQGCATILASMMQPAEGLTSHPFWLIRIDIDRCCCGDKAIVDRRAIMDRGRHNFSARPG
jgi:hypothetical protein